MKVKSVLKATSVLLSAIMLVSSAQVGLTAFAAETDGSVAAQETAEPTVSTPVQLLAETQEVTESVAEEPTTQPVTEKQTEAQDTTEAEPETTEPTRNSKDPEAVGAKAGDAVGVTSTFNENNGTLHITGSGDMPNYNSPYNVPWYAKRGLITKVVIEDGVTSIGSYAFYDSQRLASVSIPNSVKKIEHSAFQSCTALRRVDIPDSVTSFGMYAFQQCSSLEIVRMSQNVKELSYCLFSGCSSLESIEIPDSVTSISSSVFTGTAITTLTIPNSVTSIGGDKLSGLTNVTVRATIGSYAKLYCDRNGIDFVSTGVWNHEGECGENVSYFLDSANCVMTISGSGDIKNYNSAYSMPWELYRDYIKTLVIEDGVTSIGSYAFYDSQKISSVSIPNSVTKIEYDTFQNCKALKTIDIPDSVTSFGNGAFQNCSSLESVRLPQYIKKLSYNLFNGCTSLDSIYIPDSVTSIEGHVFQGCESLKTIEIPAIIKQYSDSLFEGCKALTSFTIADGVTSIGNSAFRGAGLKAITIPNSVTYIGSNAFENCASLKNVKMSDHVTSFNPGLFSGCTSLEGFEIPNTVTTIGNSVFYSTALKSIKLPDSVISIEAKAFMNCSNLKDISVSKSITSIGSYAFKNCSKLQHFLFPDTLTTIGIGSFHNTPLNEIKLPDSLTFIRGEAFRHCTNLTDVVIPESVTSIEPDAFRECEKLQYILVPETVTNIGARLVADCENVAVIGSMNSAAYDYTVRENVRFLPITGTGDGYAICETGEQYENMTLRFTSSDGDRVYTKILTADDENVIYGIDREKTYTAEVCSRNGNVFCSKDNISFGESRSVSVAFENTKAPLDVKVIVVDENGDERDGFTASWSDKNGKYISDSKTLNERIGGEQLSCEIKLGNGLLRNYKAPKKANITVSEYSENTVTLI